MSAVTLSNLKIGALYAHQLQWDFRVVRIKSGNDNFDIYLWKPGRAAMFIGMKSYSAVGPMAVFLLEEVHVMLSPANLEQFLQKVS